jgi:putative spermidine/putrescine transport system substrate-binding protein
MWLSTDIQTKLAMELVDSPANKEVVLPADVADNLTYGAATVGALRLVPPADVIANRDAWLAGWNAKVAR